MDMRILADGLSRRGANSLHFGSKRRTKAISPNWGPPHGAVQRCVFHMLLIALGIYSVLLSLLGDISDIF